MPKKEKPFQPEDQPPVDWIIQQIDEQAVIRNAEEGPRKYLGASVIGQECKRATWYAWRWCGEKAFEGRMLRLFERGHREEQVIIEHLRQIGMDLDIVDPATGKQYRHSDIGGHFGGGRDGRGRWPMRDEEGNVVEWGRWFLLEFKTYKGKRFDELKKEKVKKNSPKYYGQMQVYMNAEDLDYCLFIAINKDTDEYYMEWVKLDRDYATRMLEDAEEIIGSQEPPQRLTEKQTDWRCRFCDFHGICHGKKPSEENCRSCANSEPIADGQWRCNKPGRTFGTPCDDWKDIAHP